MTKRRVVVTGLGIISPVGNTLKQAWDNIVNGVSGIAPITHFDTTDFATKIAGEIKDFDVTQFISSKDAKKMDPFRIPGLKSLRPMQSALVCTLELVLVEF